MHVAMIIDNERLTHEHVMLKRLAVGLIDYGVQLTRIVPDVIDAERVAASERRMALAPRINVPMRVLPWMRRRRLEHLVDSLQRSLPDVIYASGRDAWTVAAALAGEIDRPVALDVWSFERVMNAPRRRTARCIGGYVVPTAPLAAALRKRVDPDLVSLIQMGVAVPSSSRTILSNHESSIAVAVIGSGTDLEAYEHLLHGLSRSLLDLPQVQIVLELRGPEEHKIWREAERLGLGSRIVPIQDASLHRPLLTRCDVLVMPEAFGEVSSLMLECMAAGLAVIAREDPHLDMLIDDKTAILVRQGTPEAWAAQTARCLRDPALGRRIGSGARDFASRRHRSSDQVNRLVDMFDKIVSGEGYPFSGGFRSA